MLRTLRAYWTLKMTKYYTNQHSPATTQHCIETTQHCIVPSWHHFEHSWHEYCILHTPCQGTELSSANQQLPPTPVYPVLQSAEKSIRAVVLKGAI